MGKETKDKNLEETLVSFAENGYKVTNPRDFTAGMGPANPRCTATMRAKDKQNPL